MNKTSKYYTVKIPYENSEIQLRNLYQAKDELVHLIKQLIDYIILYFKIFNYKLLYVIKFEIFLDSKVLYEYQSLSSAFFPNVNATCIPI